MDFDKLIQENKISTANIDKIPATSSEEIKAEIGTNYIKTTNIRENPEFDPQVVDNQFGGETLKGEELIEGMEKFRKEGFIRDPKIAANGVTDFEGMDNLNDYIRRIGEEAEENIKNGRATIYDIKNSDKLLIPEATAKEFNAKAGFKPVEIVKENKEENTNKNPMDLDKVEPIKVEPTVVSSNVFKPTIPQAKEEIQPVVPKEITVDKTYIAPSTVVSNNITVETSVKKEITKIIDITQGNNREFAKFKERRFRGKANSSMVPLPLSNAFVNGMPISSNAILEGMRYDENKTEYDNMIDTLSILADFVEIKGLGKVDHFTLAKLINYLEFELLYLAVYKASTDGRLRIDLPCMNPDCAAYADEKQKIAVDIPIDEIAHPENEEEFVEHVKNMQLYENSLDLLKHSPSNIQKDITDEGTGIKYTIGLPTILDFLSKSLNYQNEDNKRFSSVLQLIPFIKNINIPDYEAGVSYNINTFDELFEELLKNTPQEIFETITSEIENLIKGKMVTFYIDKKDIVCPICHKPYSEHVPMPPRDLLFQIPAVRKTGKIG